MVLIEKDRSKETAVSIIDRAPVAQLVGHRAVMWEVTDSNTSRINVHDLKITEEKALP